MIVLPCEVKAAKIVEFIQILVVLGFATFLSLKNDKFGDFFAVTILFMCIFVIVNIRVL